GFLLECFLHADAADYFSQPVALSRRRFGRFLRAWHNCWYTLCRAGGHQIHILIVRFSRSLDRSSYSQNHAGCSIWKAPRFLFWLSSFIARAIFPLAVRAFVSSAGSI